MCISKCNNITVIISVKYIIVRWWHEFYIKMKLPSFVWDRFLTICDGESCHDSYGQPPEGWWLRWSSGRRQSFSVSCVMGVCACHFSPSALINKTDVLIMKITLNCKEWPLKLYVIKCCQKVSDGNVLFGWVQGSTLSLGSLAPFCFKASMHAIIMHHIWPWHGYRARPCQQGSSPTEKWQCNIRRHAAESTARIRLCVASYIRNLGMANQIEPSSFEIYFEFLYFISRFQTTYIKNRKWHVELFQPDIYKTLEVFNYKEIPYSN